MHFFLHMVAVPLGMADWWSVLFMGVNVLIYCTVCVSMTAPPSLSTPHNPFDSPLSPCCLLYPGWSTPIFSSWWRSMRPEKSISSSLNCELSRLIGWDCAPVFAAAGVYVLIMHSWGMNCSSRRPCRYEHSSELPFCSLHLVFRYYSFLVAPYSHQSVFLGIYCITIETLNIWYSSPPGLHWFVGL